MEKRTKLILILTIMVTVLANAQAVPPPVPPPPPPGLPIDGGVLLLFFSGILLGVKKLNK